MNKFKVANNVNGIFNPVLPELHWIGSKGGSTVTSEKPISIHAIANNRCSIIFRGDAAKMVDEKRVQIAFAGNRMYLKISETDGWKASKTTNNNTKSRYCQLTLLPEVLPIKTFYGDFDIKYEPVYDLYYITLENHE